MLLVYLFQKLFRLLELLKVQYLAAEQDGTYGDIIIKLREDRSDGDIGDLSEYN